MNRRSRLIKSENFGIYTRFLFTLSVSRMKEKIRNLYTRRSVSGGLLAVIAWGGLVLSTVWISDWFNFSNGRVQVIGILMNSLLSLGLLLIYLEMARDTAVQAELQETQTRLMELQAKPVLKFQKDSFDGEEAVYQITNEGPGIGLDIALEIQRSDIDESHICLARSPRDNPNSSPSVLRPSENTIATFSLRVPTESDDSVPLDEFHKLLLEGESTQVITLRGRVKFGTGRGCSQTLMQMRLGDEFDFENAARHSFTINPS